MQKCVKDNWMARAAHEKIETQHQKQCDGKSFIIKSKLLDRIHTICSNRILIDTYIVVHYYCFVYLVQYFVFQP